MFVRKRRNRSGTTSIVVVDKSGCKFRELKTIGVSSEEKVILELYQQGKRWISSQQGLDMFAVQAQKEEEKQVTDYLLSNIENIF